MGPADLRPLTRVELDQLAVEVRERILRTVKESWIYKKNSQPLNTRNCGCVFKNDQRIGIPSGKLIDSCGLKGFSIGAAQVSPHHANFVINRGGATAEDVRRVIEHVRETVRRKTGHLLQLEVRLIGEW